jgi:hypothetical protein
MVTDTWALTQEGSMLAVKEKVMVKYPTLTMAKKNF